MRVQQTLVFQRGQTLTVSLLYDLLHHMVSVLVRNELLQVGLIDDVIRHFLARRQATDVEGLLHHLASLVVCRDLQDVPAQFIHQSSLHLARALLQELLYGLVTEHIVADRHHVGDHLLEYDALLLGSAVFDLLLDDSGAILV